MQAPQTPVSHPTCVPVRPHTSRRKWTRSRRGSISLSRNIPLTRILTGIFTEPPSMQD